MGTGNAGPKRAAWQLQEEETGPWHLIPQISCCILGLAGEPGLTWREEPATSQEFRPLGGTINNWTCPGPPETGEGSGKEQWKKEAVSHHQSRRRSRALTQVSKGKLSVGVLGVRVTSSESPSGGRLLRHLPTSVSQDVSTTLSISTLRVRRSQPGPLLCIPLSILEKPAEAQPVSQVRALRPRDAK